MKKLNVLFAAVILMMSVGMANAQKFAVMDVQGILEMMPEKKKADADLKAFLETKQTEIEKKAQAAEAKYKLYMEEAPKKTAEENKTREAEMKKLQEDIQAMQKKAATDLQTKQDGVFGPIEKKFQDAVDKVAKANSFDFILDINNPVFVYKAGPNVTADVKKALGL